MDENSMTYEFLKENIYNKTKRKILIFTIKAEYNIISNFLFDPNILSCFFQKELNNNCCQTSFNVKKTSKNNNNENSPNYFILSEDGKDPNSNIFSVKTLYKKHCPNHSMIILRLTKKDNSNLIDKENTNKVEQFLDTVISFYIDIKDNSTILLNELYSNLSDEILSKFNKFLNIFYEKLKVFVKSKMNKYYCFESILIEKNMTDIYKYLLSCKLFKDDKIKIKKINKMKNIIEISCEVKSLFQLDSCEGKLFIKSLSNDCSLVEIVNLINIQDYNSQEKLLNLKSLNSLFLKKLRDRVLKEEEKISSLNNKLKNPNLESK
jgi:hypothetical protein